MARRIYSILCFCTALLIVATSVWALNPIVNPSFESGQNPWVKYTYVPSGADGCEPTIGCIGSACPFNLLSPPPAPDGDAVCGLQSSKGSANGGVRQSFTWAGGASNIYVSTWAYSHGKDTGDPYDNGCRVRMGLASGDTDDRDLATWVTSPWSSSWNTISLPVPGSGTYTLFIEGYQPNEDAIMSTLWDNVVYVGPPPAIVGSTPTVTFEDPLYPDSSVTIRWTTDVASTSQVDYGMTSSLGTTVSDTDPEHMTTNHCVVLTYLTPQSLYYFRVTSTATDYTDWSSSISTFQTPIKISNVTTHISTDGSETTVNWNTDVPTTSQVEYWQGLETHSFTSEISTLTTDHQVTINGLPDSKQYKFQVISRNQPYYTDAISDVGKFWTRLPTVSPTLANGDFEEIHDGEGHSLYPWVQYTMEEGVSGYHPIDGLVGAYPSGGSNAWCSVTSGDNPFPGVQAYDGSYFLGAAASGAYKNGGVFQRVSVTPGTSYALTVRYITHRVGGESSYSKVRIGVDPNGGIDPRASSIKWWIGYSPTNDNQWNSAAVTVAAGSTGVATVFLEFQQLYSIEWHVGAIDDATFSSLQPVGIGELKASQGSLGGILENRIVTYADTTQVWHTDTWYRRAYVEEDNRTAGIEVLFPVGQTDYPITGNKLTVAGALGVYDKEAAILASSWTIDHNIYTLQKPFAMPQASLGKTAKNQPVVLGKPYGLCNIGLRVRIFGKITYFAWGGSPGDMTVYINDGSGILDGSTNAGIRAYLMYDGVHTPSVGDYIAVTGVLSVQLIDPNHWPDPTDYYTFAILTNSFDDWQSY